jgi:NAD(P)-dependent dehydrogenase (short-subunit alcohol dehydrogenase family)
MKLEGKVALITGGGTGIGAAIAKRFVEEGAKVCITGRRQNMLDAVSESLPHDRVSTCSGDVTVYDDVQRMVAAALVLGEKKIDILVNNAALAKYSPFLQFNERDFDEIISVCLKGYFRCGQAVAREMTRTGGGKIINIASIVGQVAVPGSAGYGSAKGGIVALTKIMALELAKYNIHVNAIAPGPILTPLLDRTLSYDDKKKRIDKIPSKRLGIPEDVAGPAVFLASEDSNYVVGHILNVDGGLLVTGILD